jgi:hypothetical protein
MLPVERGVVDWERDAILAPLFSLASLYKNAKARPGSPVRISQNLSKWDRSSTSLTIFSLNLAENYQPVNELYQTADHPALSPKSRDPEWRAQQRVNSAALGSPRRKPARNTHHLTWRVGEGDACMRFGLAHFLNGYSFLMISLNLHDIWAMFCLILSRCETLDFLIVIRT